MTLQDNILALLGKPNYAPLDVKAIQTELDLDSYRSSEFKKALAALLEDGQIAKIKKDLYVLPKDADLISGIIRFKNNGSALLIPDKYPNTLEQEPIPIRAEDTGVALHGDHILARVTIEKPKPIYRRGRKINSNAKPESIARVKRILKRARNTVTGTLRQARKYFYVIPDDPRMPQDIIVDNPTFGNFATPAQEGFKVIVRLEEWLHRKHNLEGEIIQVLGPTHSPQAEYDALLHKYDLKPNFPDSVLREVNELPTQVVPQDLENRLDCRDLLTLTIDPDDAKDFDDALSLEKLKSGNTRIGIHIADVCSYVRSHMNIDHEARNRGNSTYLVGSVIPMLPQALSNGICSLVEGQNRLTKTVFLTFDAKGSFKGSEFANTVICSNKRLTYHQAYAFLKEEDLDKIRSTPLPPSHQTGSIGRSLKNLKDSELQEIKKMISELWFFASKLRQNRMKTGSLDFDMPEVKIFVDTSGAAERIETIEYDESHQLIEEFMLAANESVAKALFESNVPLISRVHDDPDPEKLNELRETLSTYGIQTGDLTKRQSVIRLLNKIKEHPQGHILKIHFLRSLRQASYRAKADGHYGLYKTFYTHFTSPIRRYSDLIVHRIFDNYLIKQGIKTAPLRPRRIYTQGELENLAQHVTATEQNSTEAERESVKIKLLEFFEREQKQKTKTSFDAIITDVKNHGLFIELTQSMAFGFIHISTIRDDLYRLNTEGTALIGRRRGRAFRVGDKIEVVVESVDRFKRQIDFTLADSEFAMPDCQKETTPKAPSPKKNLSPKKQRRGSHKPKQST